MDSSRSLLTRGEITFCIWLISFCLLKVVSWQSGTTATFSKKIDHHQGRLCKNHNTHLKLDGRQDRMNMDMAEAGTRSLGRHEYEIDERLTTAAMAEIGSVE